MGKLRARREGNEEKRVGGASLWQEDGRRRERDRRRQQIHHVPLNAAGLSHVRRKVTITYISKLISTVADSSVRVSVRLTYRVESERVKPLHVCLFLLRRSISSRNRRSSTSGSAAVPRILVTSPIFSSAHLGVTRPFKAISLISMFPRIISVGFSVRLVKRVSG